MNIHNTAESCQRPSSNEGINNPLGFMNQKLLPANPYKFNYKLLKIPYRPSENESFVEGDVVLSYRSAFDEIYPYEFSYIEGTVIKVLKGYLLVHWYKQMHLGYGYTYKNAWNGGNTFEISTDAPHLLKMNKLQLAL